MSLQSDLRNFFGKRNAETDQEPSSSGCSESDQSKSSKKTSPAKKIENSYLALLWRLNLIMSGTRSDLSINIDACQPIGFSYGQACK